MIAIRRAVPAEADAISAILIASITELCAAAPPEPYRHVAGYPMRKLLA